MKICAIIPTRLNSKRIPNKPLVKIGNQEILLRTYNQTKKFFNKKDIYVFADSKKIEKKIKLKNLLIIKGKFRNGTERVSAGLKKIKKKYDASMIISCDNAFINLKTIQATIKSYKKIRNNKYYCASTVHQKSNKKKIFHNKSVAKIVLSNDDDVMYISRSPIPNYYKKKTKFFTHHGPVCIKNKFLLNYNKLKDTNLHWPKIMNG